MSATRELFQSDKELRNQLVAVTKADWFLKSLAYAKADFMDTPGITREMLEGARLFELTLLALPEIEPRNEEPVTSGLSHEPPQLASRKPKTDKPT